MPLPQQIVGTCSPAIENKIDARWLMAYAASIDDFNPRYLDTTQTLRAHPVFPVCLEWDAIVALRFGPGMAPMSAAEQARAVHAEHDLHLLKPLQPGLTLFSVAHAIAVEARKAGANLVKRIDTVDADGTLFCRTYQHSLYRGVALLDGPQTLETPPPWPDPAPHCPALYFPLPIPPGAAHVYTECARIWNPIHTDHAHALAAGLPGIILHGTITLARAVSLLVHHQLGDDASRVTRLGCRFSGMVRLPSALTLRIDGRGPQLLNFSVLSDSGSAIISRGFLCFT